MDSDCEITPHTRLVTSDRLLSYLSHKAWPLRVAVPLGGFLLIHYSVLQASEEEMTLPLKCI